MLMYVELHDTRIPPGRSWVTATGVTVVVDVLLGKPIALLRLSAFNTVRGAVHAPCGSYSWRN